MNFKGMKKIEEDGDEEKMANPKFIAMDDIQKALEDLATKDDMDIFERMKEKPTLVVPGKMKDIEKISEDVPENIEEMAEEAKNAMEDIVPEGLMNNEDEDKGVKIAVEPPPEIEMELDEDGKPLDFKALKKKIMFGKKV